MEKRQSPLEALVMKQATVDSHFWQGKRVLVTGHTGFKGSWLCLWLTQMGAQVKGYALAPPTTPSLFEVAMVGSRLDSHLADIRDLEALRQSVLTFDPEIILHLAAQPLVRYSYREPLETYQTNVMGSLHLLEVARSCPRLKAMVMVTSDKCYENREWDWGYRENEPMGGRDPYSNSKGCAELVTAAYRASFFDGADAPAIATARAGNVIGGGDWAEDRLIPDVLNAFSQNRPVTIRSPLAIRPWQHVLEPLGGYLILAQQLYQQGKDFSQAWNFGPCDEDARPVKWILNRLTALWGDNAHWALDSQPQPHEAHYLKLDISKARSQLHWSPCWDLGSTLARIVVWHRAWLAGDAMQPHCLKEIADYQHAQSTRK
jgi:CDP-glucose 4,6-dehydratase